MKTIFVSSTFRDFQAERDILNSKVRPRIDLEAGKYGETVNFCDLRWGIDTSADSEEAATRKILSVCMDQIDRSSPYMIVLLGDRYGYIPGEAPIRQALEQRGMPADALGDLQISITQLEIEYGLLSRPENKPHVYVYVRRLSGADIPAEYKSESALHRQKLDALLERIKAFTGGQVRYYDICLDNGVFCGLGDFAEMVCRDLQGDLQEEWKAFKNMPPFEKERMLQRKQILEKKERLRLHKELAEETLEKILGNGSQFWALKGNSGCGKSVMFSYVCHRLEEQGMIVIPALCQSSPITGDPSILLDYLIFHMENALGQNHRTFELNSGVAALNEKGIHRQKLEYLEKLCAAVPEDGPKVILALDGLDQLYTQKMSRYNAVLPNTGSAGVRVLVSAVREFGLPGHFSVVELRELEKAEIDGAIDGIQSSFKKTVSPGVRQVLTDRAAAGNLLYLNMAIMRLCLMNQEDFEVINQRGGGMAQIEYRQQEILTAMPEQAEKLAVALLESTAAMDSGDGIRQALCYLAVSRGGLRMADLGALVQADGLTLAPLDFHIYTQLLQEFFMVRQNGCIDFQHKVIRNGLLERLGADARRCHEHLFGYFHSLPAADLLRSTELVYHAYYSGNGPFIAEYVATMRVYGYYRAAFRLSGKDPGQYAPADFSMERDYDFLCQQIAADLHGIIMSENAQKIEELMEVIYGLPPAETDGKELPIKMLPIYWAEFLIKLLPPAFGETDDELRMLYAIFSGLLMYTEELCLHFEDPMAKRNVALCHKQLALLASKNTNRSMADEALEHIRSYVNVIEEQAKEKPTLADYEEVAGSRDYLMTLLLQRGNPGDLEEVLRIGQGLLDLYERIRMPEKTSRVHFNMGLAWEQSAGDRETRDRAFKHYVKAIELSARYAEEKGDPVSITYRILSNLKLGEMCLDVANYPLAAQVYSLAYDYAREAYEQYRDGQSREYVLMAQEGIGLALLEQGGGQAEKGRKMLTSTLIQAMTLLRERSDPGLMQMCRRLQEKLKS